MVKVTLDEVLEDVKALTPAEIDSLTLIPARNRKGAVL